MREGSGARWQSGRRDQRTGERRPPAPAVGKSGVRPRIQRRRDAAEILSDVLAMTREALWASPRIECAELLLASRAKLIEEAVRIAGPVWTPEEETLVRRIAALDRELLERIHGRALQITGYR
jgi:hypothetical protein